MNERIPKLAHNILLSVMASESLVLMAKTVGKSKSGMVEHLILAADADEWASAGKETPEKFTKRIKKRYTKMDANLGFEAFWDAYPRKTAKKAAEDAYCRLSPEDRNAAFLALGPYAESRAGQEPEFTPHASTWLNQRRWEDSSEPAKPKRPRMPDEVSPERRAEVDREMADDLAAWEKVHGKFKPVR